MYFEKPGDLIRYSEVFTRVRDMALSPEESADLLTTVPPMAGVTILGSEKGPA